MSWKKCLWSAGACCLVLAIAMPQFGCGGDKGKSKKPGAKPPSKAATQPEKKPVEKPAPGPVEKPAPKPVEKPAEKPVPEPSGNAAPKPAKSAAFELKPPLGLPEVPIPKDNPMTAEKVALGKMLYFDKRVSKDETISCATCHDPKLGWTERTATSTGIDKQVGGRNSPTVINSAYAPAQFWDGREPSLEAQAVGPVGNPIEMGHTMAGVVARFNKIPAYKEQFQKVFGTDVTEEGFAKAVAAFERTVLSGNSPYDKFKAGDKTAMSESAQRGMKIFEEAGCANCHEPPLFSSYEYENAGIGLSGDKPDVGRMEVTKKEEDKGKFRIPALRSIADTAPYFHDGSAKTLEEAVAAMAGGGMDNPNLSEMLKDVREAKIDEAGKKDLVEFLKALSGEYPVVEPPKLP